MPAKNNTKKSPPSPAGHPLPRRSFEWPLLIYPVLFLAAAALLYVVNRSIEREAPVPSEFPRTTQGQAGAPDAGQAVHPTPGVPSSHGGLSAGRGPQSTDPAGDHDPAATSQGHRAAEGSGQALPAGDRTPPAVDVSRLQGVQKTIAILRVAIQEKDQAMIKQCIAELVAMGDQAVLPLNELLRTAPEDTALWAATALARIGTPAAAGALLDQLAQAKEGTYKEQLAKRVASIENHDSWPLLLDTMMQAGDASVTRAAGESLSLMADAAIIDELVARHGTAATPLEAERLAQLIRNVQSSQATDSLLKLAGNVSTPPQDDLQRAALAALANIGDAPCISHLLQRLEASPPGTGGSIFNAITQIDSPQAQSALLYAAAGNKEVSAEQGRTAAIYALKNYPDPQTVALLERIVAQEQNARVLTAAVRTLNEIQQVPHRAITAKADDLLKSEATLPLPPVSK
ncbi:MAG: hypothetical protein MUC88_04650 [Planctomycetes bacterium]|jgi:HEAT repeat protein|nr:hypothetical protein [Planctomycetota bacterium]